MKEINEKYNILKSNLLRCGKVLVAFSGGTDSTFLLKTARDVLGEGAIAITALSPIYVQKEIMITKEFTKALGIKHILLEINHFKLKEFTDNSPDRCYYCKKELFKRLKDIAMNENVKIIIDGTNSDDKKDYRPGLRAVMEEDIYSPLADAELTKEEIRFLAKGIGLSNCDRPAQSCLATRIPYDKKIRLEDIERIDKAEKVLMEIGLRQVRVRLHEDIARIEIGIEERRGFLTEAFMDIIVNRFKELGFKYITLDLEGYRTGSLNEMLEKNQGRSQTMPLQ